MLWLFPLRWRGCYPACQEVWTPCLLRGLHPETTCTMRIFANNFWSVTRPYPSVLVKNGSRFSLTLPVSDTCICIVEQNQNMRLGTWHDGNYTCTCITEQNRKKKKQLGRDSASNGKTQRNIRRCPDRPETAAAEKDIKEHRSPVKFEAHHHQVTTSSKFHIIIQSLDPCQNALHPGHRYCLWSA